ncbi:eg45-like domain containing protein [Quercus suber]|uniref:Eg45-like domain containing protein n=1 Tax=Quercus suber TaxID=58331 RepID=A0AAW0LW27_QUESU
MGVVIRDLIIVTFTICLTSVANAAQGTATYYTAPYVQQAMLYGPTGQHVGEYSLMHWGQQSRCPTLQGHQRLCGGTIDLSEQAFSAIAYIRAGRIKIEYTQ